MFFYRTSFSWCVTMAAGWRSGPASATMLLWCVWISSSWFYLECPISWQVSKLDCPNLDQYTNLSFQILTSVQNQTLNLDSVQVKLLKSWKVSKFKSWQMSRLGSNFDQCPNKHVQLLDICASQGFSVQGSKVDGKPLNSEDDSWNTMLFSFILHERCYITFQ